MRDKIFKKFGNKAFSHALFYNHEKSLRFELSEGEKWIEQFISAYKKAEEISNYIFNDSKCFFVCLSFYGAKTLLSSLSIFRDLRKCQITIPKDRMIWREQETDDECYRYFVLFETVSDDITCLLWAALSSDLGISPRTYASIYLISKELDVIVHPYDDRGMDVISTDNNFMKSLFQKFHNYLLDNEIKKMRKTMHSLGVS